MDQPVVLCDVLEYVILVLKVECPRPATSLVTNLDEWGELLNALEKIFPPVFPSFLNA